MRCLHIHGKCAPKLSSSNIDNAFPDSIENTVFKLSRKKRNELPTTGCPPE